MAKPPSRYRGEIPLPKTALSFKLSQAGQDLVIKKFYEALGTPIALSCWLQYEAGEGKDLVSRELDPRNYADAAQFKNDFAAISFLKKSKFISTGIRKDVEALKKFVDAEASCESTNRRLRDLSSDTLFRGQNVSLLHATIRKIERILGDFDVAEFFDSASWGPGSTAVTKVDTSAERKFESDNSITSSLYQLVGESLKDAYPLWHREGKISTPFFVEYSKVITVPKNAKVDRVICVEPGLNIWFQKAVGAMIKSRLRRNGLNLKASVKIHDVSRDNPIRVVRQKWLHESQKVNGIHARTSSKSNDLATVDFSSASDMISYELCRLLLPPKWFAVMRLCRTARYKMPQDKKGVEPRIFHKFSSMGNGFTFELESLIFYAAALAVTEVCGTPNRLDSVSVFGDDVVIPVAAYASFVDFTKFLGFVVHPHKSFCDGPFRESCGEYFFDGVDVKPLFLKEGFESTFDVFNLMNRVRAYSHSKAFTPTCDLRFLPCWRTLYYSLPKGLRIFGTVEGGTGCIWENFDHSTPIKLRKWVEGYSFPCYTFPAAMQDSEGSGVLINRIFSPSALKAYGNSYAVRDATLVTRNRLKVQQWYDFGPWI